MAAVDKVHTEFGYVMGGTGTDATTVDSGTLRVKAMAFAGNADNATCACTIVKNGAAVSCYKFKTNGSDLDAPHGHVYFGERGVPLTGLAVTPSHADDRLYIFIA